MKVSVDYDGTLDQEEVQDYIQDLIDLGNEVHIVTLRHEDRPDGNDDLYATADQLGIDRYYVHFTNGQMKIHFFQKSSDYAFHLDDCEWQLSHLQKDGSVEAVWYEKDGDWKSLCDACL